MNLGVLARTLPASKCIRSACLRLGCFFDVVDEAGRGGNEKINMNYRLGTFAGLAPYLKLFISDFLCEAIFTSKKISVIFLALQRP